jgi:hypothetical protein
MYCRSFASLETHTAEVWQWQNAKFVVIMSAIIMWI